MLLAALILAAQTLLASPCDLVGAAPIVTDLSRVTSCGVACGQKKPGAKQGAEVATGAGGEPFHLLGQSFGSLQEVHDWLVQQSQDPNSSASPCPTTRSSTSASRPCGPTTTPPRRSSSRATGRWSRG